MVRLGGDLPRRGARHVRFDDIPTDTFTPRTYQVELLESALHGNTIACLGSASSKVFLGLMVMREMSHQIRAPLEEGGKRSVYLADSEDEVESLWTTLYHHTDMAVGRVLPADIAQWSTQQWATIFSSHNILVLSAPVFLHCLQHSYLLLSDINLLVLDDCHKAVDDHAYVGIMSHVNKCEGVAPHLLCLTAAILGSECTDPKDLSTRINSLEATLNSKAETSMLVISERFGCRPKESVIECEVDEDVSGMGDQLASILYSTWHFLEDSQVKLDDRSGKSDPLHVPKFAISECINILQTLGSWCAASIAENLISQLEKIVKHECNQTLKLFLRYTLTQLRLVVRTFEIGFTPDYIVDELLNYTTPKVREFIDVLRKYKPEMDFMIITREGNEGETSDLSDDDGNDDDSLDLSSSDEDDDKGKDSKHIHIAVKRKVEKSDPDSPFEDEKKLSGLVFVDNRYVAFALNKMMEEVCSWDENLCFVKSSHITGQGIHRPDGRKDLSNASRKQEEVLRKFRMQERNLMISTSVLEEGVDIPKCNLVIRFDPPRDYRSYTLSKGRARARDSEYVILVDEELMEDFSDEIQVFKGIEQVLIGAGRGRQDLEDAQEIQQFGQLDFSPLPTFCPLNQPGAASVSMKNSIALVNRYCAKLPSDAFTHLTPQCRVCPLPSDPSQYVAFLRLPVNSPIKEELKGAAMPSRQLAKMAVALQMCELLYKAGELDCHLQPVGKEMFVYEEEEDWDDDEEEGAGQARPGTTKRKQYYNKKMADVFVASHPKAGEDCFLYHMTMKLTGPITEDQNTRGRKIYAPEESAQSFGVLLSSKIPHVPSFPVYTRSGEVTVSLELLGPRRYSEDELEKLIRFHHFVFSSVLHLEKDPMVFSPEVSIIGFLIVPLNTAPGSATLEMEWTFVEEVNKRRVVQKRNVFDGSREIFSFDQKHFEDAVVMPSYRNIDQPQHFYVAEIRTDLSPLSPFPSPELYKTFAAYYTTKYGLTLTNMDQPLLDVDHTSARLNLLTPRYMNQKGRALPTSSVETKRARRENLQQKQILVPELCDIHVFSASLWRKAVCLPAILYRMNYLLLAEELRKLIAAETGIGKVQLVAGFRFPRLDFGFETNPEKLQTINPKDSKEAAEASSNEKPCSNAEDEAEKKPCVSAPTENGIVSAEGDKGMEFVVHDSSPDDDKTDPEASSDSDSGVVLSESDTVCTSSLKPSACLSARSDQLSHNGHAGQNGSSEETEKLPTESEHEILDQICSQSPGGEATGTKDLSSEFTSTESLSSGNKEHDANTCDVSDPFSTPSTSRPPSPTDSDSDDSIYEDAVEFTPCSVTARSSMDSPDCDIGTPCQTHKLSPQPYSLSNQDPAPSAILPPFSESSTSSPSSVLSSASSLSTSSSPVDGGEGSSVHSKVLKGDEDEVPQFSLHLPQSLPNCAVTSTCSQKVPDHSSYISSCCACSSSAFLSETGDQSITCSCAISSDLSQAGQTHAEPHPEKNRSDFISHLPSHQLTKQKPQDLNHGQSNACDNDVSAPSTLHKQESKKDAELEADCYDFLDVRGSNHKTKPQNIHTVTFPSDPEISHFTKPGDEVKLTFEPLSSTDDISLDANWAQTAKTTTSNQEWAPDEDLTTFEVTGNLTDLSNVPNEPAYDVFTETSPLESKLSSDIPVNKSNTCDVDNTCVVEEDQGSISMNLPQPAQGAGKGENCSQLTKEGSDSVPRRNSSPKNPETRSQRNTSVSFSDVDSNRKRVDVNLPHLLSPVEAVSKTADNKQNSSADSVAECGWGSEECHDPSEWTSMFTSSSDDSEYEEHNQNSLQQDGHAGPVVAPPTKSVRREEVRSPERCNTSNSNQIGKNGSVPSETDKELCEKDSNEMAEKNSVSTTEESQICPKAEGTNQKTGESQTCGGLTNGAQQQHQESSATTSLRKEHTKTVSTSSDVKQFDIGTWNVEQKTAKAVHVDDNSSKTSKDAAESWPLLISLDHDTDLETFMGPSPCLLLQALTMSNANDFFSLERLETIGDSFLKYAITVYLYCCYPGTHEGKLSYLRSKQVSNYNLYRLGRRKGFAERMVSTKFEPYENWLPPGYIINEDRRRGPVPKVVIATSNPKLSAAAPVNFLIEEEELESDEDQKKETEAFHAEVEEIDRQQAVDQQHDISSSHKHAMIPYCLQLHHGIPDKSIADCVEALIGCYLTTCGKQAALTFMSWLGLKVLPRKRVVKQKHGEEVKMTVFQELQCPPSPLLRSVPEAESMLQRLLEGFSEFEAKINYTFRDRSYLLQAFTHASYHYNYITDCYQRLEFLGDAILDYVITRHLYEDSQRYSPGILTDLRSALVNNNIFAALAVKWDFHKFFKAISPSLFIVIDKFVVRQKEREDQIDEYEEVKKRKKLETDEEDEDDGEEAEVAAAPAADVAAWSTTEKDEEMELEIPKALGDIFESVAGAIYLDSGMSLDTVWRVYYGMMKPHIDKYLKDIPKSPVRELLEMEPETAKFEKPERTLEGKIRVTVNVVGKGVFYGVGRNYRIAKSAAAKKALRFIRNLQMEGHA